MGGGGGGRVCVGGGGGGEPPAVCLVEDGVGWVGSRDGWMERIDSTEPHRLIPPPIYIHNNNHPTHHKTNKQRRRRVLIHTTTNIPNQPPQKKTTQAAGAGGGPGSLRCTGACSATTRGSLRWKRWWTGGGHGVSDISYSHITKHTNPSIHPSIYQSTNRRALSHPHPVHPSIHQSTGVLRLFPCPGPTPRLRLLPPSSHPQQEAGAAAEPPSSSQQGQGGLHPQHPQEAGAAPPHPAHCFSLSVEGERGEEWRLCAASQEDVDAWVHALGPYVLVSGGGKQGHRGE